MRTALETVGQVLLFTALLGLILWPLELLWPRRAPRLTPRAWLVDLGCLVLGALTLRLLVDPLLAALTARVPARPAAAWRLGASFLGAELGAYALHRAMHELPWLWRLHAVHHAPRELDWMKAWRQHPIEVALHALVVAVPGLLVGAPLAGLGALWLLRRIYTALLHANVDLRLPPGRLRFLGQLVATPAFHRAHHSHDPRLYNSNYASTFPLLDRLFGTYCAVAD
ncbi:MAG: sterol desaturase family protein [Polyangia bacterium]